MLRKDESIVTADQFVKYMASLKGWRPEDLGVENIVILDLSVGRRLTALLKDATKARPVKKSIYRTARLFNGRVGEVKVTISNQMPLGLHL